MVLLEGMAAGCAVVASDIEGYRTAAGGHAGAGPARATWSRCPVPSAPRWPTPSRGAGRSAPEARKAATEYARAWSMDALAERYVDVYDRAIAAYGVGTRPTTG